MQASLLAGWQVSLCLFLKEEKPLACLHPPWGTFPLCSSSSTTHNPGECPSTWGVHLPPGIQARAMAVGTAVTRTTLTKRDSNGEFWKLLGLKGS